MAKPSEQSSVAGSRAEFCSEFTKWMECRCVGCEEGCPLVQYNLAMALVQRGMSMKSAVRRLVQRSIPHELESAILADTIGVDDLDDARAALKEDQ